MTGDQLLNVGATVIGNGTVMALISWVIKNGMTQMANSIKDMANAVQAFQLTQSAATLKNNQMLTILVYDKLFSANDPAVATMIRNLIVDGSGIAPEPSKQ